MTFARSLLPVCLGLMFAAVSASAQLGVRDAWVLPWGMVRVGAGGSFDHHDGRFDAAWSDLLGPLDEADFLPLATLRTRIDEFLTATGGPVPDAGSLTLGDADLEIGADTRVVPMGIAAGLLPRMDLTVTVPIHRSEVSVRRFAFADGNVGANPDPAGNAAAFAQIDAEFAELGASPLLPLASSPLGVELTARAADRGAVITLPGDATGSDIAFNALIAQELGVSAVTGELRPWRIGDAEATLKVRLLGNIGDAAFPEEGMAAGFRTAVFAGIRVPLGSESEDVRLIDVSPASGLSGWRVGGATDLFLGQAVWVAASADYASIGEVDVRRRLVDPARPLSSTDPPSPVRWAPPSEVRMRISPRVRLERAIAIGVVYEMLRLGEGSFTSGEGDASLLNTPAGTVQRLSGTVRFSTLAGYAEGARVVPLDAAVTYGADLSGPAGAPDRASLRIEGRIYHRFWGGR